MKKIAYLFIVLIVTISSCAKRGRPSGGEKDVEAPKLLKAFPVNYTTQFSGKEIRLNFDEYVKLKDINKQLIISPPLKFQPIITPQTGASKFVKIKILDTLQPNTTYSFNFGNSIVDNNEENAFPYFKYIFSTGKQIDSLQLSGSVEDALSQKTDDFVSVLLYEVDTTYTDSIIYKKQPRYITNTLDSATTFQFENLRAGKYILIALKEEGTDYKFNPKTDKIGFVKEAITLPTDKTFKLKLFKETIAYRALKPKHERKTRIKFRYEGVYNENIKIKLITKNIPKEFQSKITKNIDNDTLNYWFKPALDLDSLNFVVTHQKTVDSFRVKMRKKVKTDSLIFKLPKKQMSFSNPFAILPNIPIVAIDDSKIKIIDNDSLPVKFTTTTNALTNLIALDFDRKEKGKYQITVYPKAFTDFYNHTNDTLNYRATLQSYSKFGNMRVIINNAPKTPIIVQLTDKKGTVKQEQFAKGKNVFDFNNITPATYNLRVVYDANANQKYDTGNYLKKQQPERVSYYPGVIEVRANWDIDQQFTLQ